MQVQKPRLSPTQHGILWRLSEEVLWQHWPVVLEVSTPCDAAATPGDIPKTHLDLPLSLGHQFQRPQSHALTSLGVISELGEPWLRCLHHNDLWGSCSQGS